MRSGKFQTFYSFNYFHPSLSKYENLFWNFVVGLGNFKVEKCHLLSSLSLYPVVLWDKDDCTKCLSRESLSSTGNWIKVKRVNFLASRSCCSNKIMIIIKIVSLCVWTCNFSTNYKNHTSLLTCKKPFHNIYFANK